MKPVVHMAELSNDPVEQLALNITYEINHKGSVHLTKLAPRQGKAVRLHVVLQRLWRVGRGFRA